MKSLYFCILLAVGWFWLSARSPRGLVGKIGDGENWADVAVDPVHERRALADSAGVFGADAHGGGLLEVLGGLGDEVF